MIYLLIKRGSQWDEMAFPLERKAAAQRVWTNCLLQGILVEWVGSHG